MLAALLLASHLYATTPDYGHRGYQRHGIERRAWEPWTGRDNYPSFFRKKHPRFSRGLYERHYPAQPLIDCWRFGPSPDPDDPTLIDVPGLPMSEGWKCRRICGRPCGRWGAPQPTPTRGPRISA